MSKKTTKQDKTKVYVMIAYGSHGNSLVKIGITKNIDKRIIDIQPYCPYNIKRVAIINEDMNAREAEHFLHQVFKKNNTQGEWFEFNTANEAEEFGDIILNFCNIFDTELEWIRDWDND